MESTKTAARPTSRIAVRALCEGALFIAVAQILGYLKLFHLPWGGSLSLMMLPILLYAVRWGVGPGLLSGLILGILQFMLDGGIAIGWQSIIGDYIVACMLLGLAGVFRGRSWGVFAGVVLGCIGRFVSIYITGATLWAVYMPEQFFGMTMTSPWFYSFLYNGFVVGGSMALCLIVTALLFKPLKKYFLGQDIRK